MSGGLKNEIGVLLCKEQLVIILLFFGAGGQVVISGIRNLSAFGVEQELLLDEISTSIFKSSILLELAEDSSSISLGLFLNWVLLAVAFLVLRPQDGPINS
ncbi:hypothetical protein F511_02779 [Dorcoceras hygrometricum]|uniref:Uncharacterized protein n=1 Tax=Dorcoceras hygrometricum TaxID=472368 RepID=A0A2Z7BQ08_9LAMI|nr:hypothetical protein F511_02779 [Dorcoceras hygrometricum]